MNKIKFYKYQGAGNDFVVIDARLGVLELSHDVVARLCDRRYGVGADGLMTLEGDPSGSDFYMRYWNSDGGQSTMCGNGGRCIAHFAHSLGLGSGLRFNSVDGEHTAEMLADGRVKLRMIDVGQVCRTEQGGYLVNTGSPHYVEFVESVMEVDVASRGALLRYSFEGGVNVNFVELLEDGHFRIRTYERGVEGETLACGTGATAAAVVCNFVGQKGCNFIVEAMGGTLEVAFEKTEKGYENIFLTGEATPVFTGEIEI